MRKSFFFLWALIPTAAVASDIAPEETAVFEQLGAREQILEMQRESAEAGTRKRALFAYRMARRRELGFAADLESRLDDARGFDMAVVALRRSAEETRALGRELDRVRADRTTMESALLTRALAEARRAASSDQVADVRVQLARPVRGTPVAVPSVRRDGPTKVELHHDSLDLLARMNEPVRAVASGEVKRVEPLPQGGFAVVTAHAGGLVSILSGMRDVMVSPGAQVQSGQTLGLAGRNLDGAAVVSVEIWRNRRAEDAAKLLRVRLGA
jgi:murein DD-endopeptidase MepM/ murein hydrolase activator NlpD